MVAWTTIPNTDVDPDSPVTTSLMTALRDNPQAIAEGAASAPRVVEAGLASAVSGKLVTNGNTHDHIGGDGNAIALGALEASITPWIQIGTAKALSGVNTVTLSGIDATYNVYMVQFDRVYSPTSLIAYARFSANGGSTWYNSTGNYNDNGVSANAIKLAQWSAVSGAQAHGRFLIYQPFDSAVFTTVDGHGVEISSATAGFDQRIYGGLVVPSVAVNAVQFSTFSANFTSGNVTLYGLRI